MSKLDGQLLQTHVPDDFDDLDDVPADGGAEGSAPVSSLTMPSHEDNADTIVDPMYVSKKPGRVITQAECDIHTHLAHRLFYGRRASTQQPDGESGAVAKKIPAVIGLVRFITNINQLYTLANMDDPYADAKLIEIDEAMREALGFIDSKILILEDLIAGMDELRFNSNASTKPLTLPLEFRTPYFGFQATRMVKRFDNLVRLALTAKHVGLILDDDWGALVSKAATTVRRTFLLSTGYRYTGAKRDDFAANNEVARNAVAKYGDLPQDILRGERKWRPTSGIAR